MGIGRLYWYALSFLLCGLYSQSHFDGWPNGGWGPHNGFKNKYRNDPDIKSAAATRKAAADADKLAEEVAEIIHDYERKADRADRKSRHAREKSRGRGESRHERERRHRRDREREDSLERSLHSSRRRVGRKLRRHERRQQEVERVADETLKGARERSRKKERERNREHDTGERRDDVLRPPLKGVGKASSEDGDQDADNQQHASTEKTDDEPEDPSPEQEENDEEVKITLDSNGQPQLSIKSDKAVQDAQLFNGIPFPLRPSFNHASDHDFKAPLPQSVREELLSNDKKARAASRKRFSLLMAFCRNQDILLTLVSYLPIPSIISLYAISKTFHYLFNRHHTAFILSSLRTWAPNAETIFPWRCYKSLCTNDPLLRQKMKYHGLDEEEAQFRLGRRGKDLREVPTLRWLQMAVWREGVCKDMLIMLATKGLRCPPGTLDAVKRMWFILDLPLNSQRIALMRNTSYIGDHTLYGMTAFMLKVDMSLTIPDQAPHPAQYAGMPPNWAHNIATGVPLRKLLLAERHLTPLWRVLRGWTWDPSKPRLPMTKLDTLRLWARHKFHLDDDAPDDAKQLSILDMPWHEVGTAGLERTGVAFFSVDGKNVPVTHPAINSPEVSATHLGRQLLYPHRRAIHLPRVLEKPREPLLRPDELVLREGVRRQMKMHEQWVNMMLWGFFDEVGFNWPVFTEEEYYRMDRREASVTEIMEGRKKVLRTVATGEVQQ